MKIILFVSLLVIVNVATFLVVTHNQRSGFYRWDADAIAIPIFITAWFSFLATPLLILVTLVPNSCAVHRLMARGVVHRIIVCFIVTVLYLACALVPLLGAVYWFCPRHYLLSAILAFAFIGVIACMMFDVRKLLANHGFQPTAAKGGHSR
jgi:hypothetical protein